MKQLNVEWFTRHDFTASYKQARNKKSMLALKRTKQIMADFGDRKDKTANPVIEVYGPDGLMMISRIVNFERELRRLPQDVPITLRYEKLVVGQLTSIGEFLKDVAQS